jgi:hypothetical protein
LNIKDRYLGCIDEPIGGIDAVTALGNNVKISMTKGDCASYCSSYWYIAIKNGYLNYLIFYE